MQVKIVWETIFMRRIETGSEHLAEFYEIRIMLSDCEEALKETWDKVTLKINF